MKTQNICKFPSDSSDEALSTRCFVYESAPENFREPKRLPSHRLLLVAGGSATFSVNGEPISCRMGDLLFFFEGETRALTCHEEMTCMYVDFSGIRASELFRRFGIHRSRRLFGGYGGLIPLWKETLARSSADTLDLVAEGILLLTLSRMSEEESVRNSTVTEMLEYTEHHFTDPSLSITLLSEKLSYNPKYLSHLFKKEMGMGYSEYLRDLRLNYARGLLDHGLDSIKNVALLSGYADPLYFSEVFKKVVGMSPKEYIQSKKEPSNS